MVYVKPTPEGRITIGLLRRLGPRPDAIKTRVAAIAPEVCRCIIENRGRSDKKAGAGIQLCHAFPRRNALDNNIMTSIEYYLGMERDSLSLDSRWNCFFAGNDLHSSYDKGFWCLLPSLDMLNRYMDATKEDRHEYGLRLSDEMEKDDLDPALDQNQTFYTYTFLALSPEMKQRSIQLYNGGILTENNHPTYYYPFNQPYLSIKSHLHPKFVILSLGGQLASAEHLVDKEKYEEHVKIFSAELDLVAKMYNRWTTHLTQEQDSDPTFPDFVPSGDKASSKASADFKSYRPPTANTTGSKKTATRRAYKRDLKEKKRPRSESVGRVPVEERVVITKRSVTGEEDEDDDKVNNNNDISDSDSEGEDDEVEDGVGASVQGPAGGGGQGQGGGIGRKRKAEDHPRTELPPEPPIAQFTNSKKLRNRLVVY